ncbi:MAG: hypothetical protein MJ072_00980, partial [Clostridia bacterium]|nr:hypothetical protein [Clostridia bacterium]
ETVGAEALSFDVDTSGKFVGLEYEGEFDGTVNAEFAFDIGGEKLLFDGSKKQFVYAGNEVTKAVTDTDGTVAFLIDTLTGTAHLFVNGVEAEYLNGGFFVAENISGIYLTASGVSGETLSISNVKCYGGESANGFRHDLFGKKFEVKTGFKYALSGYNGEIVFDNGTEKIVRKAVNGKVSVILGSGDYSVSVDGYAPVTVNGETTEITFAKNLIKSVTAGFTDYGSLTENADGSYTVTATYTGSGDKGIGNIEFNVDMANSTTVVYEFDYLVNSYSQIYYESSGGVLKFNGSSMITTNGPGLSTNYSDGNISILSYTSGVKHHFVFVLDLKTKTTRVFIDGVEATYVNGAHVAVNVTTLMLRVNVIGSKKSTTIENIRVYDGASGEEVASDYLA